VTPSPSSCETKIIFFFVFFFFSFYVDVTRPRGDHYYYRRLGAVVARRACVGGGWIRGIPRRSTVRQAQTVRTSTNGSTGTNGSIVPIAVTAVKGVVITAATNPKNIFSEGHSPNASVSGPPPKKTKWRCRSLADFAGFFSEVFFCSFWAFRKKYNVALVPEAKQQNPNFRRGKIKIKNPH
jgi:hypothetical protein